ncbi:MAG TPA: hypothetical protein GXZ74_05130 [Tissierellia bacterium]|nr:hypothetical protein [Tissierellia bacterium]
MENVMATLQNVVNIIKTPASLVGVIALMIGGYYILAGGQEGRQKGKYWIIGAVVGLLIIWLAPEIISWLKTNTGNI